MKTLLLTFTIDDDKTAGAWRDASELARALAMLLDGRYGFEQIVRVEAAPLPNRISPRHCTRLEAVEEMARALQKTVALSENPHWESARRWKINEIAQSALSAWEKAREGADVV